MCRENLNTLSAEQRADAIIQDCLKPGLSLSIINSTIKALSAFIDDTQIDYTLKVELISVLALHPDDRISQQVIPSTVGSAANRNY